MMSTQDLELIGREKDVKHIIDLVLPEEVSSGKDVTVISIIGMGGLGKTTLAQLIYNNEKVEKHFTVRAWVCVSEDFDILRLTKEIIESATGDKCDSLAIDPLQRKLQKLLSGNRFLIVLDDIWNEDGNAWDRLKAPFCFGAKGSIIIVTTRAEAVSRAMDVDHGYILNRLEDDDCLSLLLRHAFHQGENYHADPKLIEAGKELVKKRCQGLPLAAKALGGVLSRNRDIDFWNGILKSHIWSSMENETMVMKALRVSYHHFPPHIKKCFAYCAIFFKDYEFKKEDLIKLWMAQGFILPENGKDLEATGSEYFDFLLSRSFFQIERSTPLGQVCKMHDCIHDLAMSISSDECLRIEHNKPTYNPDRGHRHSSFIMDNDTKIVNLEAIHKCKGLRTFIVQHLNWNMVNLDNQVLSDLIVNFRCLRVLMLQRSSLRELPCSISNLKHLRYLDLSDGEIEQLPESLSSLYNLQTLDLSFCSKLRQLPKETRKLQNLRHLDLLCCDSLKSMPPEMGKLTCLQTMSRFIVGKESGHKIGELKQLTELKGTISIAKLQNVTNAEEVEEVNLKNRPHIKWLMFEWDDEEGANMNRQHQASFGEDELGKIFEALQPHTNIIYLDIEGYRGTNYPSWLQDTMLPNLQYLSLRKCANHNSLPPLGQFRMLEFLDVSVMNGVKSISQEFYGNREIEGFPLLKYLDLHDMPNLEEWCKFQEGEFPCLQHLSIANCPKLMKMPDYFPTLKELSLRDCYQLACLPKLSSLIELDLVKCNEILLQCVPHLTSLSKLAISDFKELTSLPRGMLQSLDSLKSLAISLCPKLVFLQEERLPNTLQHLRIEECEMLRERCRKEDGEDWIKISHVSRIEIDGNIIS